MTALGAALGEEVAARSDLGPEAETGQQVLLFLTLGKASLQAREKCLPSTRWCQGGTLRGDKGSFFSLVGGVYGSLAYNDPGLNSSP